uniref:Uncharacterized protein n=1 Tax=Bionectria ochroleuca TaxID=29856 RepID=A0A8H7NCZ4_BIOOC
MESTSVISQTHFCESFGRPYSEFEAVERSEVFPVVWEGGESNFTFFCHHPNFHQILILDFVFSRAECSSKTLFLFTSGLSVGGRSSSSFCPLDFSSPTY